jgi:hypothetical protein
MKFHPAIAALYIDQMMLNFFEIEHRRRRAQFEPRCKRFAIAPTILLWRNVRQSLQMRGRGIDVLSIYDKSAPNFFSILILRRNRSSLFVAAFRTRLCALISDASCDGDAETPRIAEKRKMLLKMRTMMNDFPNSNMLRMRMKV